MCRTATRNWYVKYEVQEIRRTVTVHRPARRATAVLRIVYDHRARAAAGIYMVHPPGTTDHRACSVRELHGRHGWPVQSALEAETTVRPDARGFLFGMIFDWLHT